jgi:stalled ribosome rescue protein Dom34
MSTSHAVVSISHEAADILAFDDQESTSSKIRTHEHPTGQHRSQVRSEHEFFAHVCDAIDGIEQVVVAGPRTALTDFEHYARKHRPSSAARVLAYEAVDHPTRNQLVAMARKFFERLAQGDVVPVSHGAIHR